MFSGRRYVIELSIGLGVYSVAVAIASVFASDRTGSIRLLWLLPAAATIPALIAIVRGIRSMDEMQRAGSMSAIAFAYAATAFATLSFGFAQNAGIGRGLSWLFVWPLMGVFWIVGSALARRHYR